MPRSAAKFSPDWRLDMTRKKGGLGQIATVEEKEDLLDSVFGAPAPELKPEAKPVPAAADTATGKMPGKGKENRVGKYFLRDRDLAKAMKLFAVQNDMKEIAVIEAALRAYLGLGNKSEA